MERRARVACVRDRRFAAVVDMKGAWMMAMGAAGVGAGVRSVLGAARRRAFTFNDKTVAITGASRGLGFALARECLKQGARVAICARDEHECNEARATLEAHGTITATACDVRDRPQLETWLQEVRDTLGPIDVLINNAGVIQVGPLETTTDADFEEAMEVHFYGPLHAMRTVLPEMRRRKQGRIINISSFGGLMGVPHMAPYSASKFALTGVSEAIRAELANDGVFLSTICPWLMRTGGARHAVMTGKSDQVYAWFIAGAVLPLVTQDPDRAARHILDAARAGRAEVILTTQGKLLLKFKNAFPELTFGAMRAIERFMPSAPPEGTQKHRKGKDVRPKVGAPVIERLNRWAGERLNEYANT